MSYILWLIFFIWIPSVYLWLRNFHLLWKYRMVFLSAMVGTLLVSIPWDILAVRNHIWYFPQNGNLGMYIGELPLEEYLFMMTVTLIIASVAVVMVKKRN